MLPHKFIHSPQKSAHSIRGVPKNKTKQKQERGGEREKEISLAKGDHKGIYPFSPLLQKGEQRHRLKTRFATSRLKDQK